MSNTFFKFFNSVLIFILITIVVFFSPGSENVPKYVAALSSYGSEGPEVNSIQEQLHLRGFYFGDIDGIFGVLTDSAVRRFQQKIGLTPNGICGPRTLDALGLPTGGSTGGFSESEIDLMARVISAEARGEPYTGQVAVGAVILNRVAHPAFPDSITEVCYQSGAFSSIAKGYATRPAEESCVNAALDALNGWDPSNGAVYFYNPDTAESEWIRTRPVIRSIGHHVFCG